RARVLTGFLLHIACWLVGAAELWVLFALLGERVGALQALAIDSIVAGLRSFAFMIPAAAGVQEASFVLAGAAFGVPATAAVAASLARRARDLVLGATTLAIYALVRTLCASRQRALSASR
ncbi:MAG TPA: lysylphosphatidylglycerol synthase domain-containing protein, partial [Steroidobacteraceae bacterium]